MELSIESKNLDSHAVDVQSALVVLDGITGILVPGVDDQPGTRFWVRQQSPVAHEDYTDQTAG